jgi:hypothetical protein
MTLLGDGAWHVYAGLQLAEGIPSGPVHIEAFTGTQWVTLRGDLSGYPF